FAWLLFSLVLVWALWQGFWEIVQWLKDDSDRRKGILFFPDEVQGDIGPGTFAVSRGELDPRDERSRRQANDEGVALPDRAERLTAQLTSTRSQIAELTLGIAYRTCWRSFKQTPHARTPP